MVLFLLYSAFAADLPSTIVLPAFDVVVVEVGTGLKSAELTRSLALLDPVPTDVPKGIDWRPESGRCNNCPSVSQVLEKRPLDRLVVSVRGASDVLELKYEDGTLRTIAIAVDDEAPSRATEEVRLAVGESWAAKPDGLVSVSAMAGVLEVVTPPGVKVVRPGAATAAAFYQDGHVETIRVIASPRKAPAAPAP